MSTMTTDRLVLRPWTSDDVQFVFDMYSRWVVQRLIGTNPQVMTHVEQAVHAVELWNAVRAPQGCWAVTLAETGEPVGNCMLRLLPASGEEPLQPSADTEIVWHLHPDHWGHGYATEAARRVLEHGFENGLAQIYAVVNSANESSIRVCGRLGMEDLGSSDAYYNANVALFVARDPNLTGTDERAAAGESGIDARRSMESAGSVEGAAGE